MLFPGDIVGGEYRVVRVVGQGGMGAVFEGESLRTSARVAIKMMHASFAEEPELVARFEREAQAAARIGSEHIVDVLEMGALAGGDRFMIMEFLEGESLHARIHARGQLPPIEIAELCSQLLRGLSAVHAAGIIHRDLKPANVFLVPQEGGDFVKILDFGICKTKPAFGAKEARTAVGSLLGTLPYMAPEHFEHGSSMLDERADIYSVGVILYRAVTGRLPYSASTVMDLVMQMRAGAAPHLCDVSPEVDRSFADVVDRAMAWSADDRYPTADDFRHALTSWIRATSQIDRMLVEFLDTPPAPPPKSPGSAILGVAKVVKAPAVRERAVHVKEIDATSPRSRPAGARRAEITPTERRAHAARGPTRPPPLARPPTPHATGARPAPRSADPGPAPPGPRAEVTEPLLPNLAQVPGMREQAPTINAEAEIAGLAARMTVEDQTVQTGRTAKRKRAPTLSNEDPTMQRRRRARTKPSDDDDIPVEVELEPDAEPRTVTVKVSRKK
ncbi:MAG: serine/threonine protein kinase [Myxococcales bacterium]|nr:serine/threonine protein kinase [Myxococcales bacterium]